MRRLIGLLLLVGGIALLYFGFADHETVGAATETVKDAVAKSSEGDFSSKQTIMIAGGVLMALIGTALTFLGGGKKDKKKG